MTEPEKHYHDTGDCIKYDPKELGAEDEVWDAIVIGSGIGGLTVASLMATAGKKVMVLEKHWTPGGCCHTFESNGYRFGTGIHYVPLMGDDGSPHATQFKRLMDTLTPPDDPVIWDKMDEPFETTIVGAPSSKYEKVYDLQVYQKYLKEKFPAEEKSIEKYFEIVREANYAFEKSYFIKSLPLPVAKILIWTGLHKLMDAGYSKWTTVSLQEVLEDLTENKELQAVLAANYGDFGTDPSHAPFITHAALVTSYKRGAYCVHGGSSNIPTKIVKNIITNGGKVFICANVKRILIDSTTNEATGVEMHDGSKIKAKVVVSDAGLFNTATHLLPSGLVNVDFDEDGSKSDPKLHPSATCLSLFVGLQQDSETLNLPSGVFFIHPSNELVANYEKLQNMSAEDALKSDTVEETMEGEFNHLGPVFVTFPPKNDKAWKTDFPGKTTIEILAGVPWKWFEPYESQWDKETKSHGKEYEKLKLRLADKTWQRVVEVFESTCPALPKGLESIDHYRIGTPLTYSHFLGSDHGAIYGLDHDLKRFDPKMQYIRLRPKVPEVPGLFLCGQDVAVGGFNGAMLGGLLCAGSILEVDDPFTLIRKIDK